LKLNQSRLEIFHESLGNSRYHSVLTCRLTNSSEPHSPRYDLLPVGLFQKLNEGILYGLAEQQQAHIVKDYAEVLLSQGNSFIHNEERIEWISDHVRSPWFVELGDPDVGEDAHLLWSFSNVNDAVLFKLTWHTS
jgi:hypothetical protein